VEVIKYQGQKKANKESPVLMLPRGSKVTQTKIVFSKLHAQLTIESLH